MEICKICQQEFKVLSWKHLYFKHNLSSKNYDLLYGYQKHGIAPNLSKEKIIQAAQKRKGKSPWNKGLTKELHPSLMKISQERCGLNNPAFKILDKEAWKRNMIEGRKAYDLTKLGKTYEELYGDKAEEIKLKLSNSAKKRKIHGHTGFKHSDETKLLLKEKTAKRISEIKDKISKPQRFLFEILKAKYEKKFQIELEYLFGFYSLDIAIPELKICIEVDGDFWHVNEQKGYQIKYKSQIRNKNNEKSKTTFLLNKNWSLIRIWESDINEKIEEVKDKVENFINEKINKND